MNTFLLRLLLFVLFISSPLMAQTITFPSGSFRDAGPQDFKQINLPTKYFNELWTYHANLDNGTQVLINFSINDFGSSFKGRVTGTKLMITRPDGKNYVVNKEYSPDTFRNEPERNFMELHPERTFRVSGSFDGEHRVRYRTNKDGILYDVDLTFYDIAQGKVLGDGIYKFGSNEVGLFLLIPHAKVKGFVAIDKDTVQVQGTGYMDHIYQNNLSNEIIERSFRVKSGDDQNGFYFHFLTLKKSSLQIPIGYGVRFNNGNAQLLTPSKIERLENAKSPSQLDTKISVKPYQMDEMIITVEEHLNSYSLLNELGGIKRLLAKQVVGGELLEMNGRVTINGKTPGFYYYLAPK